MTRDAGGESAGRSVSEGSGSLSRLGTVRYIWGKDKVQHYQWEFRGLGYCNKLCISGFPFILISVMSIITFLFLYHSTIYISGSDWLIHYRSEFNPISEIGYYGYLVSIIDRLEVLSANWSSGIPTCLWGSHVTTYSVVGRQFPVGTKEGCDCECVAG